MEQQLYTQKVLGSILGLSSFKILEWKVLGNAFTSNAEEPLPVRIVAIDLN